MMFFTLADVVLLSKRARNTPRAISEELRGWKWSDPPVLPPSRGLLTVSELTGGLCPTLRPIYLKLKRVKPAPSPSASRGSLMHYAYSSSLASVKRLLYQGVTKLRTAMQDEFYAVLRRVEEQFGDVEDRGEVVKALWDHAAEVYSSEVDRALGKSPHLSGDSLASYVVPLEAEFPLDGSLVGLGLVRADALIPHVPAIVELKTGYPREEHYASLAGYALAYESVFEQPMDFGVLCYVQVGGGNLRYDCRFQVISDSLRQAFLESRDRGLEIADKEVDPGLPQQCPRECPYLYHCGGRVG